MNTKIQSLHELQLKVPRILKAFNADPSLALAALANPFLALERLGYELSPDARVEIERHIRFGKAQGAEVAELEAEIRSTSAGAFDPSDPDDASRWASERVRALQVEAKRKAAKSTESTERDDRVLAQAQRLFDKQTRSGFQRPPLNPQDLTALVHLDPLVAKVARYRDITLRSPPFASKDQFEAILAEPTRMPFTAVTWMLKPSEERKGGPS